MDNNNEDSSEKLLTPTIHIINLNSLYKCKICNKRLSITEIKKETAIIKCECSNSEFREVKLEEIENNTIKEKLLNLIEKVNINDKCLKSENEEKDKDKDNKDINNLVKEETNKQETIETTLGETNYQLNNQQNENLIDNKINNNDNKNKDQLDKNEEINSHQNEELYNNINNNEQINNQENHLHLDNNNIFNKIWNYLKKYKYLNLLIILPAILLFYFFLNNKKEEIIEEIKDKEIIGFSPNYEQKDELLNKSIIGIDFGSSFSGFSFAIDRNNIENNNKNIQPTEIIIERNTKKGYNYGTQAHNVIDNKRTNDYIYFNKMKTQLDPEKLENGKSDYLIEADYPKGYKMELKIVIIEYLKFISDDALKELNRKRTNYKYEKNEIKWVVTVPAIWDEFGKHFMRECAEEARMEKVSIALEPEAASLTIFDDSYISEELKKPGKIFMLIDAGGYTVDITLNEIIDEKRNLRQLSPPSGGPLGSMNINKDLIDLIYEIYGKEKIENIINNDYQAWKLTLDSIEQKKKEVEFHGSDSDEFRINADFKLCNDKCSAETSYGKINYDKSYVNIPSSIMKKIIYKRVTPIINHIKFLFNKFETIKINQLVLTGGFSNCEILRNEITKNFNQSYEVNILSLPETSVMKGAVIYGISPNKIASRISPYSIGIKVYSLQKDKTECRNQIEKEDGLHCEYFDKFITIGEAVKNNYIVKNIYSPLDEDQENVLISLYYSNSFNPLYINEMGVYKYSDIKLEIKETDKPLNERKVEVEMKFGSCITINAKNKISGKTIKTTVNYYSREE